MVLSGLRCSEEAKIVYVAKISRYFTRKSYISPSRFYPPPKNFCSCISMMPRIQSQNTEFCPVYKLDSSNAETAGWYCYLICANYSILVDGLKLQRFRTKLSAQTIEPIAFFRSG